MRPLTASEKFLLGLCVAVLALVGMVHAVRDFRARQTVATHQISELGPQLMAAEAAAADAPFWETRQAWLDSVMPAVHDPGKDHSQFLEELQTSARARGLTTGAPVLLKPESAKHAQDFSVTLEVTGPDGAVSRWLAELQSPEKLRIIKYLLLAPQSVQPPRMSGTVTIAKLFKP